MFALWSKERNESFYAVKDILIMKVLISFKYKLFGVFSKKTYEGELYVNDLDKENHFLYNPVCICITLEELCCIVQYM